MSPYDDDDVDVGTLLELEGVSPGPGEGDMSRRRAQRDSASFRAHGVVRVRRPSDPYSATSVGSAQVLTLALALATPTPTPNPNPNPNQVLSLANEPLLGACWGPSPTIGQRTAKVTYPEP